LHVTVDAESVDELEPPLFLLRPTPSTIPIAPRTRNDPIITASIIITIFMAPNFVPAAA
jgi:hypothetical protein